MRVAPGVLAALAVVLVFLPLSLSAPLVRETVTTNPSAAIPVTLAAGAVGSATIGTSATSASVTYLTLGGSAELLKIQDSTGTPAWNVQVKAISASGFGALDSLTIVLKLGATTQTQVVVAGLSVITQSIGTAVALPDGGGPIQVLAAGGVLLGTAAVTLQVVLTPAGGGTMVITYPVTFTLG